MKHENIIKKKPALTKRKKLKGNTATLMNWRLKTKSNTTEIRNLENVNVPSNINVNFSTSTLIQSEIPKYGIQNEPLAKECLQIKLGVNIMSCGLFVDKQLNYLAASPDGINDEESIVEIKCPMSIKDFTPEETFENKKLNFMTLKDGELKLKKTHDYYFQIQGQLHISERKYCYFAVWTPKGMIIEKIIKDNEFWKKIEPNLKKFYIESLLPELIDSRFDRGLPLRTSL